MNVMIWDIDWYYAEDKTNLINVDAMKISSYHKQCGDIVHLVTSKFDVQRVWDKMYIIKENKTSPTPPLSLMLNNPKVIMIGSGWSNPTMIGSVIASCRPDYLLYPNMQKKDNTPFERSEFWRFLDSNGKELPLIQDASRKEKKNFFVVADRNLWSVDEKIILQILRAARRSGKFVSFLEPISIEKLIYNQTLRQEFLKLKFKQKNNIRWTGFNIHTALDFIDFYNDFKTLHRNIVFLPTVIQEGEITEKNIQEYLPIIAKCMKAKLKINITCGNTTSQLIRVVANFLSCGKNISWLEYITYRYNKRTKTTEAAIKFWLTPSYWSSSFRFLLGETYKDTDFLLTRPDATTLDSRIVPTNVFIETFKYGI